MTLATPTRWLWTGCTGGTVKVCAAGSIPHPSPPFTSLLLLQRQRRAHPAPRAWRRVAGVFCCYCSNADPLLLFVATSPHNECTDTVAIDRAAQPVTDDQTGSRFSTIDCYVGGLKLSSSKSELRQAETLLRKGFEKYDVENVRAIQDKNFAFIKFASEAGASQAIQEMNGQPWADSGQRLRVSQAWAPQASINRDRHASY
jgi:hypothetical protein